MVHASTEIVGPEVIHDKAFRQKFVSLQKIEGTVSLLIYNIFNFIYSTL